VPEYNIAILGASASGKTTFLAALSIALARHNDNRKLDGRHNETWRLIGTNDASTERLISLTQQLAGRSFPEPTLGIEQFQWLLIGQVWRAVPRRFLGPKRRKKTAKIALDLADPSGAVAADGSRHADRDDLIDKLVSSNGIVFLFDPITEFTKGDTFGHTFGIIVELAQRMLNSGEETDGFLPHYVSVCVSKFDEVKVLRTARAANLLTTNSDDQYNFPRVESDDAREFFSYLCQVSKSGTADLALNTIEQYFRPDRIRYFVTSAIGFYINPSANNIDLEDFQNSLSDLSNDNGKPPSANTRQKPRIRGRIHPINVLEPILWASAQLTGDSGE
jgi:energy-coupling factor transporter ATP-binding protein EcfA2